MLEKSWIERHGHVGRSPKYPISFPTFLYDGKAEGLRFQSIAIFTVVLMFFFLYEYNHFGFISILIKSYISLKTMSVLYMK